jgi:hypothetical protein
MKVVLHMMNTKILHIKAVLFVVLQCMFISVIKGDVTCKVGEGIIPMFTSGYASQCSGVSKITSWQECKLAAEYNRKNNIDKNGGNSPYAMEYNNRPPGCFTFSAVGSKYYFNMLGTVVKCSDGMKCVCKPNACTKCPSAQAHLYLVMLMLTT